MDGPPRWAKALTRMPELTGALRYLVGVNAGVASWNEIARAFDGNYDRLAMRQAVSRKSTCALLQRRPCAHWKRCAHSA